MKKTALITGGTRGIGFLTAKKLASLGYRVILTGRNPGACAAARQNIENQISDADVHAMVLDLSSFASVRRFGDAYLDQNLSLHLLINNAGIALQGKKIRLTEDGQEMTFATNNFGHFLLTRILQDTIVKSAPARIIHVSSRLHMPHSGFGGEVNFDFDNMRGQKWYDGQIFYKNSKLATLWMTYELQRRLSGTGVTSNAVCPGFMPETVAGNARGMQRFLLKHILTHMPGTRTAVQGSDNTVFAGTTPEYETAGGKFIVDQQEIRSSEESYDQAKAARFWKLVSELTDQAEIDR